MSAITATIVAKKIFTKLNNGGFGAVIASDETRFSVKGTLLSQFKEGGKYRITYVESTKGEYTNRTIQTVSMIGEVDVPASNPTPSSGGKHSESSSEDIFVCGVVNNLARAGELKERLTVDGIAKLTHGLRLGWRKGKFPMPEVHTKEQSQEDMNDEIPY